MFLMPDVSSNNDPAGISLTDAKRIATVARALMVKATEGGTYTFAAFRASEANARRAGLKTVAYHFVSPTSSGVEQARHLWSVVKPSGVSAICIDWENGSRAVALELHAELKSLAHGSGKRVGAYEGVWAREHGGGLPGCDFILVPDYGVSALPAQFKLAPYAGWQYTDGVHNGTKMPSSVPGIGRCDVSLLEHPELLFPPAKPAPTPKPAPVATVTRAARNAAVQRAATDLSKANTDAAKALVVLRQVGPSATAAQKSAANAQRQLRIARRCFRRAMAILKAMHF